MIRTHRKVLTAGGSTVALLWLLTLGTVVRPACGEVVTWNVTSGTWNVGGNWSSGAVPTTSSTAIIDSGRTVLLGTGVSGTAASIIVANTAVP